jgi:phage baseplate assembly protein W
MFLHRMFLREKPISTLDDVVRNVRYILDTKRGAGHFLSDFGLTETGYRTPEETIVALRAEITETLSRYERRLTIDEVEEVYDDDGRMHLHIICRLKTGEAIVLTADPRERKVRVEAKG